ATSDCEKPSTNAAISMRSREVRSFWRKSCAKELRSRLVMSPSRCSCSPTAETGRLVNLRNHPHYSLRVIPCLTLWHRTRGKLTLSRNLLLEARTRVGDRATPYANKRTPPLLVGSWINQLIVPPDHGHRCE